MKKMILYILATILALGGGTQCSDDSQTTINRPPVEKPPIALADGDATAKTKALYNNLFTITEKGTMFGQQIPTLYGLDAVARGSKDRWDARSGDLSDTNNSDIKYLTGQHPAVCGWDISKIELDSERNLDNELFTDVRNHIIAAFERGAVNTISWHAANPVSGGDAWDPTRAVYAIIPGGELHEAFKVRLDKVATFLASLKAADGEPIPLIFRPWHEHSGSGFWWGKGNATADEFVALWHFTIEYLRDVKGLHNLIYAYSPDMIHLRSRDDYMEFWPGDQWVDILGLDAYDRYNSDYGHFGSQLVRLALHIADEKNKPMAITETALEDNDPDYSVYYNNKWWTRMLYKVIEDKPVAFALVWRNGYLPPKGHFYSAFRGCYTESDFLEFAAKEQVLFEDDLPDMYN